MQMILPVQLGIKKHNPLDDEWVGELQLGPGHDIIKRFGTANATLNYVKPLEWVQLSTVFLNRSFVTLNQSIKAYQGYQGAWEFDPDISSIDTKNTEIKKTQKHRNTNKQSEVKPLWNSNTANKQPFLIKAAHRGSQPPTKNPFWLINSIFDQPFFSWGKNNGRESSLSKVGLLQTAFYGLRGRLILTV